MMKNKEQFTGTTAKKNGSQSLRKMIQDGSKYGTPHDDDWTHNDILGYVKVSKVKEAEMFGAIAYVDRDLWTRVEKNGFWVITTEQFAENGRKKIRTSQAWEDWVVKEARRKAAQRFETESLDNLADEIGKDEIRTWLS